MQHKYSYPSLKMKVTSLYHYDQRKPDTNKHGSCQFSRMDFYCVILHFDAVASGFVPLQPFCEPVLKNDYFQVEDSVCLKNSLNLQLRRWRII